MNFALTTHAQEQLAKRKLPLFLLLTVIEHPQQEFEEDGVKVYQSQFNYNGKTQLFRVFVNDSVDPMLVITIYVTSKIDKY
ncbi:DUF4258 domain-containing protein [Gloeocapsopsis crepidinum LEGE 06123]|uniref:DUF4258 domain-containing protein n=1 Tax=Gloeocapsopsis crepidinum LEGE 06123 TaxID=588587 RepID=A0ABR9V062_9CHRO|nr:DUF4258 domain-containing protein [Gloeocapsopsis crepidinum]MBE9193655.1 DUF4258 domain-containing protein [Gloeocapsopsis crepidinum LEGE 06123]